MSATADDLYHPDRRANPSWWLRSRVWISAKMTCLKSISGSCGRFTKNYNFLCASLWLGAIRINQISFFKRRHSDCKCSFFQFLRLQLSHSLVLQWFIPSVLVSLMSEREKKTCSKPTKLCSLEHGLWLLKYAGRPTPKNKMESWSRKTTVDVNYTPQNKGERWERERVSLIYSEEEEEEVSLIKGTALNSLSLSALCCLPALHYSVAISLKRTL